MRPHTSGKQQIRVAVIARGGGSRSGVAENSCLRQWAMTNFDEQLLCESDGSRPTSTCDLAADSHSKAPEPMRP
jgi:hypothetical protein